MELANGEGGLGEPSMNVIVILPESCLALDHDLCGGPIPDIRYCIVESVWKWCSTLCSLELDLSEDVQRSCDNHSIPRVLRVSYSVVLDDFCV